MLKLCHLIKTMSSGKNRLISLHMGSSKFGLHPFGRRFNTFKILIIRLIPDLDSIPHYNSMAAFMLAY